MRHEDILAYEEILRLVKIATDLGVDKVRLTGGEPLFRKGIYEFISYLTSLPDLKDISITTNGVFLKKNLEKIRSAGIKRINISLDSLRRKKYEKITGYDAFNEVWEGIELARKLDFHPVKINVVVMEGVNDDEIIDFAGLTKKYPYHIRFIEYMPVGATNLPNPLRHVPYTLINERIRKLGRLVEVPRAPNDGPAERFRFEGAPGEIGLIGALTHHFCRTCNRLRLTASGILRPCLLSDQEHDLKGPMRKGASDNELAEIFLKAAFFKPHAHYLAPENPLPLLGQMSSIGG